LLSVEEAVPGRPTTNGRTLAVDIDEQVDMVFPSLNDPHRICDAHLVAVVHINECLSRIFEIAGHVVVTQEWLADVDVSTSLSKDGG
jgi:hypothetical protein